MTTAWVGLFLEWSGTGVLDGLWAEVDSTNGTVSGGR